jgi:hypothetical protein
MFWVTEHPSKFVAVKLKTVWEAMVAVTVSLLITLREVAGDHKKVSPAEAINCVVPPMQTVSSVAVRDSGKPATTVTVTGVLGEVQPPKTD